MAVSIYYNRVKYTVVSAGTGDFVTSAAATGFRTPATASIPDGSIVSYVAFNSTQSEWETGQGAYTSGTTTVARTTVRESSNAGAKVNFTAAPTVALDFQAQDITNLPPVAINGATIGTNALAVTGKVAFATSSDSNAAWTVTTSGGSIVAAVDTSLRYFMAGGGAGGSAFAVSSSTGATQLYSGGRLSWTTGAQADSVSFDTTLSRNAAGIIQFGTTSANAAGSLLATAGTFSGKLRGDTSTGGTGTNVAIGIDSARGIFSPGANITNISAGDDIASFRSTGCALGAAFVYGWTSQAAPAGNPFDTSISRNTTGVVQFGSGSSAGASGAWLAAKGTLTGGTLADQAQVLAITATQPTTPTGSQYAVSWNITGAGSASQLNSAFYLNYGAGYTGSTTTIGMYITSGQAGTASTLVRAAGAGGGGTFGNAGVYAGATGTTTGLNVGLEGYAENGTISVGVSGSAQIAKNSATNIGGVFSAINTGTSPVQVGAFACLNQTTVPTVSAALIADNGAQTDAIFLARDNGTTVFTIADGGGVTTTGNITKLGGAVLLTTSTALTDGAAAAGGTLLNAPAAGNPTKWIGINDNGTTRYIPAW